MLSLFSPEDSKSFSSSILPLAPVLEMQSALLDSLKEAHAAPSSFANLEETLSLVPKYTEETRRIKAQMADINVRVAKMKAQVVKLEQKKQAEIELLEKKEGLLKPKE